MDGLIISTPTGSTGHSLSLGSSMLSEDLSALLITPIAPISRIPPIAIPISNFSLIAHSQTKVIIDGQFIGELKGLKLELDLSLLDSQTLL